MRRRCTAFTSTRAARPTSFPCGSKTSGNRPHALLPPLPRPAEPPVVSVWSRVSGRTRKALAAGLRALSPPLAAGYYEELEDLLIAADMGPAMAARLTAAVRGRSTRTREDAESALVDAALAVMSRRSRELDLTGAPACGLFYGINGAGKTTTIGKLAHRLRTQTRNPLVVAADTYRAAGIEQMLAWAQRAGAASFADKADPDPATVEFDRMGRARGQSDDAVLVLTSGPVRMNHQLAEGLPLRGRVTSHTL